MPKKIKLSLEELDSVLSWSIEDSARKTNHSRNYINNLVNSGRLNLIQEHPRRLSPNHVRNQVTLGFPLIGEQGIAA